MKFTPTYLYIKRHSITGLHYFGKTTSEDPYSYLGSGTYWKNHIKKHGKEHVVTLWCLKFYDKEHVESFALEFSKRNNIVESDEWANLREENGLDGVVVGSTQSDEHKAKLSAALKGKKRNPLSDETRAKLSAAKQGKPRSDETKAKISAALKGKTCSDETKAKMSAAKKSI